MAFADEHEREVRQRREQGEATVGSVMDYNPILFFEGDAKQEEPKRGTFITPSIGPYDFWAIEYGYRVFDGKYVDPNAKQAGAKGEAGKADKGGEAPSKDAPEVPTPPQMPPARRSPRGKTGA